MPAIATPLLPALHTGSCLASPRVTSGTEYCLHDAAGDPVGTIPAPAVRPVTGPSAPTLYLRRNY
jgi:hypothetical protein